MKKVRFLITVIAVLLIVMGTGYSIYWSQSIPVHMIGSYGNIDLSVVSCSDGALWDATQGKIIVNANGLFAGKSKAYFITLRNSGTSPAKLSGVTIGGFHNTSLLQLSMVGPHNTISLDRPENSSIYLDANTIKQANNGQDIIIQPGSNNDYMFFFSVGIPSNAAEPTGTDKAFSFEIVTDFYIN